MTDAENADLREIYRQAEERLAFESGRVRCFREPLKIAPMTYWEWLGVPWYRRLWYKLIRRRTLGDKS